MVTVRAVTSVIDWVVYRYLFVCFVCLSLRRLGLVYPRCYWRGRVVSLEIVVYWCVFFYSPVLVLKSVVSRHWISLVINALLFLLLVAYWYRRRYWRLQRGRMVVDAAGRRVTVLRGDGK